jgi:microcystin-dependent protein
MSVLGQKVTKLSQLNYIQPGDVFLAIRGGVSYKVFGDRIASIEQLNIVKSDYTLKLNNLETTTSNRFTNVDIRLNNIAETMFLKTDGYALSSAVFSLSSEVVELKNTTAKTTYVNNVSADIVNWTNNVFATKSNTQSTYIPKPGTNLYSGSNGSVLTWNSSASAWQSGPGLSIFSRTDISPIGTIILYGGTTAPLEYLECNGQVVAKLDYPELWNTITDTYGRDPNLADEFFQVPNLSGVELMATNSSELSSKVGTIPVTFYIKALSLVPTSANSALSSYLKVSPQYVPDNNQYLKYSNGEWIPAPITSTVALPPGTTAGSALIWNGIDWIASSSKIQSIYEHNSFVAYENSECVFTDIPSIAKKITLVISDLDILADNGTFVKIRLGNGSAFVNSGYENSCQGTFANPYQRTAGGYYSYTSNTSSPIDAAYILVRIDDFITKNEVGGLDAIITFMRSYKSLLTPTTKWVYTHTGRIGTNVVHGAGSVTLENLAPDMIGIYPPNPASVITRGQITLYWE